jgi:D-sedoheptulose 7-phosphate isomerase
MNDSETITQIRQLVETATPQNLRERHAQATKLLETISDPKTKAEGLELLGTLSHLTMLFGKSEPESSRLPSVPPPIESVNQEMTNRIVEIANTALDVKYRFFALHANEVARAALMFIEAIRAGKKILLFGNGGSAADAQHIAAEFVNRFHIERRAIAAIALSTDTSILTSISNDTSFEYVFSRQIEALGQPDDVAVAITTSGNSPNIIRGIETARQLGLRTIGLLGRDGGEAKHLVELPLIIHSASTSRIQEVHITIGHILCDLVESVLFAKQWSVISGQ